MIDSDRIEKELKKELKINENKELKKDYNVFNTLNSPYNHMQVIVVL